jgi:hypothetical protein
MKSKLNPLRVLATLGLSVLPLSVLAHQGHVNSVWHAVLHMVETNGVWLVLVSVAITASCIWKVCQRRPIGAVLPSAIRKEQEHDPR